MKQLKSKESKVVPPCGLCGTTKKPRYQTDCCNNWICGDESEYVLFSYSRNICSRNHSRFTACGFHFNEQHTGDWKTCKRCPKEIAELEMYVWYGTNEYNFEKLPNPPVFEPTYCSKCNKRIVLPDGGYGVLCGVYRCDDCPINAEEREEITRNYQTK